MFRDEHLAGSTCSKQLDSHKHWSHHHGVNSVYCYGVDRMEIGQRLTVRPAERDVPAEVPYGTARLDSS